MMVVVMMMMSMLMVVGDEGTKKEPLFSYIFVNIFPQVSMSVWDVVTTLPDESYFTPPSSC